MQVYIIGSFGSTKNSGSWTLSWRVWGGLPLSEVLKGEKEICWREGLRGRHLRRGEAYTKGGSWKVIYMLRNRNHIQQNCLRSAGLNVGGHTWETSGMKICERSWTVSICWTERKNWWCSWWKALLMPVV